MRISLPINRRTCFLIATLLVVTAHHVPAPIVEEEKPTPAPASKEESKPKKTRPKSKSVETGSRAKSLSKSSQTLSLQGPARFAGTWSGMINQGVLGDIAISLIINATGTSVQETSKIGTFAYPAAIGGNTMTWKSGWLSEIGWTFTPNNDGKTAVVTATSAFGVNGSATFQRR
ncbi:MAG: hypothetical protein DMF24_02990 [Verrucomicrobia bacterium]|nr:MAG: hypothetical protein DME90_10325 [Verrucomicrobiota bacterium]PYL62720.1 MAG: hypothetical protein DMF24_02990 [Verrucomicrobiota bacterium]